MVGGWQLTACAMARPQIISYTEEKIVYEYLFAILYLCD
jgi:hypothetical protein